MTPSDDTTGRTEPPLVCGEREMLDGWLDYHRDTLLWKCEGLTEEQLKTASCPPSNMTLLGLVRHMAEVERGWFADVVGTDRSWLFCTKDDLDGDWDNVADADVDHDFAVFRGELATYRAEAPRFDLETTVTKPNGTVFGLRWIYTHMIEEYARHNGHADLIRERIDGATGD